MTSNKLTACVPYSDPFLLSSSSPQSSLLPDICPGIAKAWRLALDPELKYAIENVDHLMKGMKRAGQMPAEGGEHALRALAEKIFQACMSKETEQISLDCLDPRTPAMLENFKDQCEERFGSLQDAFEKVDVDGVGIVSREDFRVLCHEVKATDGIFRLLEFLDPKRTGEIRLSLIDGEVAEDAMLAMQTRRQMQQQNIQALLKQSRILVMACDIIPHSSLELRGALSKPIPPSINEFTMISTNSRGHPS